MEYLDEKTGLVWTRSEDGTTWTSNTGKTIIGPHDMGFDQLQVIAAGMATLSEPKSDAERIAELEAQLAALLARLS